MNSTGDFFSDKFFEKYAFEVSWKQMSLNLLQVLVLEIPNGTAYNDDGNVRRLKLICEWAKEIKYDNAHISELRKFIIKEVKFISRLYYNGEILDLLCKYDESELYFSFKHFVGKQRN
jgi:hypothetical protein